MFIRKGLLFFGLALFSLLGKAEPWVTPEDSYLRFDLQLLASAGYLRAPLDTYPMPWSRINEDLSLIEVSELSAVELNAYYHVKYALFSSLLNMHDKHVKAGYLSTADDTAAFGAQMDGAWLFSSSYEVLRDSYAYKVAANYLRSSNKHDQEETRTTLDGSYLVLSHGNAGVTMGSIQRWWGPTWVHNLAWGHSRGGILGISAFYDGYDWPWLNNWHAETFVGKVESLDDQSLWASRLESRPSRWVTYGVGYNKWLDSRTLGAFDLSKGVAEKTQLNADVRISLPFLAPDEHVINSAYLQVASLVNANALGSAVFGLQGVCYVNEQYLGWVYEKKYLTPEAEEQRTGLMGVAASLAGMHNGRSINDFEMGRSDTIKLFWVTPKTREFSLLLRRYDDSDGNDAVSLGITSSVLLGESKLSIGVNYYPESDEGLGFLGVWDVRF